MAGEHVGRGQVAPNDSRLDGGEISIQQESKIQSAQPSTHELQSMDVLKLGEYRFWVQERRESLKKGLALTIGYECQAERRYHGVDILDSPSMEFRVEVLGARIDEDHARVGNVSPETLVETWIDFKDQQNCIG